MSDPIPTTQQVLDAAVWSKFPVIVDGNTDHYIELTPEMFTAWLDDYTDHKFAELNDLLVERDAKVAALAVQNKMLKDKLLNYTRFVN